MSVTGAVTIPSGTTPFVDIARSDWAELAPSASMTLDDSDIARLRGLGTALDLAEVRDVYVPLSRLLNLYATNSRRLHGQVAGFLGERSVTTPFVIGVAGSVAVGKSTVARLLRELLSRWENLPRVELVTTDGFLLPNAELERRGIMRRKGFPESYDQRALLRFITQVKSGVEEVRAPFYSHLSYDIVPDAEIVVNRPDILIVEGLNVLQPPRQGRSLAVSDMFDFSIYVDARTADIERWYVDRFLTLQRGAFTNPRSYFHRYIDLSEPEARERARSIWNEINGPNLRENVLPTRSRARLVLKKDADHSVHHVLLRKT
ncbi:type I pantothenate kinase [Pseudoclavibacter endophyticus]|uniref:Pantothenate kinase n=1 Tax=Pseudoclavibacter endophyticus TaxID=1778590 RepID=A0A6H9WEI8_9MICO|nr:type I pantothenate kinase [Pseudoclavibacter endophyticus]KAB1649319.1 type I pantothenate kinase [Pseudoclavibacter endophyticus]